MQLGADVDLSQLARRLADRARTRTEADVQSDLQTLLLYGGFNLHDHEVRLESQAGGGRRIDVEVGRTVIEVKKDLSNPTTIQTAEAQLAGYLQRRSQELGESFVGVLTDGATWRLYYLDTDAELLLASEPSIFSVCGLTVHLQPRTISKRPQSRFKLGSELPAVRSRLSVPRSSRSIRNAATFQRFG
jgi:hypothetical protein